PSLPTRRSSDVRAPLAYTGHGGSRNERNARTEYAQMITCLPLSHVALPDSSRQDQIVSIAREAMLTHAQFVEQVQAWCQAFVAQPGQSVAMYFDEVTAFIPALFGAWHAGKSVMLLADAQPATLM